ncbi:hypothetical protein BJY16_008434 [Actinoplanes octamycinicus]|uniref:Uncharacterized protein n=1 Tax=Actinoplanes octamycinicus TaxID=135948 RepID=A0A7W7MCM5_9ACTN|nr:hypothetical protein [Actinoplanes octamycinicus]MBB4744975.1 hypothetical protein [Actinoplanes octamycinicus]GIE55561.1 hypothetical protein Aoc01nite_09630 [Actinoplanes octamycinicus]
MSDLEPESFAEFVTTDGPGSADVSQLPPVDGADDTEPRPASEDVERVPAEADDQELYR